MFHRKAKTILSDFRRLVRRKETACSATDSPLEWWKQHQEEFPLLASFARRFLAIPASSASSERVFSHMNIVVDKRTNRTKVKNAKCLVFLRMNLELMDPPDMKRNKKKEEKEVNGT